MQGIKTETWRRFQRLYEELFEEEGLDSDGVTPDGFLSSLLDVWKDLES